MDDALRRTTHAVERYGVDENMIALAAGSLMRMPAEYRTRAGIHAMMDAFLPIAEHHANWHESCHDGCELCAAIRNGLAVAMGAIRAETDLELRKMFDGG